MITRKVYIQTLYVNLVSSIPRVSFIRFRLKTEELVMNITTVVGPLLRVES